MATATAAATKWIYDFTEGSRDMRELLGGKGAGVAEMTRLLGPDLVPSGFTITTHACVEYMRGGRTSPEGLARAVEEALERLQAGSGKQLGDPRDPLLVSVRSGARDSMPGMMDTVLNLGLNDASVEGLAERTGNPRFAWDSYRRLVQMFGDVVRGVPGVRFEDEIARLKRERGATLDTELDVDALRELTRRFQALYDFPADPREQLQQAIEAVFDSWMGERAVAYRRINGIPDDWGTAVNVQQMVYGNKGPRSGSGVAFSRDEVTGAPEPSGDFLVDAQGEDVVSGRSHAARPLRAGGLDAGGARPAGGDPAPARAPLQGHAGHRVHDRGRPPVHAADAERQAARPGRRAIRRRRRRGGVAHAGRGDRHDRRRVAEGAPAPHVRVRGALRRDRAWGGGVARRGQGRDRVQRTGRGGRGGGRAAT